MTDNEIKKALEKAINEYAAEDVGSPKYFKLVIAILDLFNRQQAEIERLKNECFCIANERDAIKDCIDTAVEEAKAEAIKAYKGKVENDIVILLGKSNCTEFIDCLEYRYKEMAGDAE